MVEGDGEGHQRAPGVPDDDGVANAEPLQHPSDEVPLRPRGPQTTRPLAVPETGTVEHDDAVAAREALDMPADQKVLDGRAVAMNEHDGAAAPALDIMHPDAVDFDEAAHGRMGPLRRPRLREIGESRRAEYGCGGGEDGRSASLHETTSPVQGDGVTPRSPGGCEVGRPHRNIPILRVFHRAGAHGGHGGAGSRSGSIRNKPWVPQLTHLP